MTKPTLKETDKPTRTPNKPMPNPLLITGVALLSVLVIWLVMGTFLHEVGYIFFAIFAAAVLFVAFDITRSIVRKFSKK